MIDIVKDRTRLLLKYEPEFSDGPGWIDKLLDKNKEVPIRHIFTFKSEDVIDTLDENARTFVLGTSRGDYYKIKGRILGLDHDLLLSKTMPINRKTFIAYRDISIFRKIDSLLDQQIAIGGPLNNAIPLEDFNTLLKNFPTSTELTHYSDSRISRILMDYFETMTDAQKKLDNYLKKKNTIRIQSRVEFLIDYELRKYEYVRNELLEMLNNVDEYEEADWQRTIVDFLLLIFPKYVAVLPNLHIKDFFTDPSKPRNRYIDLTLVDANGSIDIIEIKKPFANSLLSTAKYRDNYTPRTELSGSVVQVEKYIFHLNKWGRDGELKIYNKRKGDLPPNLEIKITNPKAMIILGRDNDFRDDQKFDFEIIKRHYANIIDIMTYDDLLRRLDNILLMLKRKKLESD